MLPGLFAAAALALMQEAAQAPLDALPPVSAEPSVLEFGFMPPNTDARGKVVLRNNATTPLKVALAQASCKCTTLTDIAGRELQPGETVELEAELSGAPALGARTSSIKVFFEGYTRPVEIPARGEVALKVRSVPAYINAVGGKNLQGRLIIEATDKQPFSICAIGGKAPVFMGFDPAKDAPRASYLVKYDLEAAKGEQVPRYWVVETDHPLAPVVDVRVRHDRGAFRPLLKMKDYRANLGLIEEGQSKEVEVEATDAGGPIQSVASTTSDAVAELVSNEEEGNVSKARIRITPRPGLTGLLYAPFLVVAPKGSQEIDCFATVRRPGEGGCGGASVQAGGGVPAQAGGGAH